MLCVDTYLLKGSKIYLNALSECVCGFSNFNKFVTLKTVNCLMIWNVLTESLALCWDWKKVLLSVLYTVPHCSLAQQKYRLKGKMLFVFRSVQFQNKFINAALAFFFYLGCSSIKSWVSTKNIVPNLCEITILIFTEHFQIFKKQFLFAVNS